MLSVSQTYLLAQGNTFTNTEAKKKIEKYFYTNPDSAAYFLHYVIRLKEHDTTLAKHYNNLGLLYITNYKDSAAIYLLKSAELGSPKRKLATLLNLSLLYKKQREFDKSLAILQKLLPEYKTFDDQAGLSAALGSIGSIYSLMENRSKAISYFKEALAISKIHGSARNHAIQQQNLAKIYFKSENYQYAAELYSECIATLKNTNDIIAYNIALSNYGSSLFYLKQYRLSYKILSESLDHVKELNNDELEGIIRGKLAYMDNRNGNYRLASKQFEKAVNLLSKEKSADMLTVSSGYIEALNAHKDYIKALKIIKLTEHSVDFKKANAVEKLAFYKEASVSYVETHQSDIAIETLKKIVGLQEDVAKIEGDFDNATVQAKYQNDDQSKKLNVLKKDSSNLKAQQKSFYPIYYGLCLLLLLIVVVVYFFNRKSKQKSIAKEKELSIIQSEKDATESELVTERMRNKQQNQDLENQKQELISASLNQINLREQLAAFVTDLKENNQFSSAAKLEGIENQLHWKLFMEKFEAVNPFFIQRLTKQYPQLNQSELQFCALLKLNLSYKEIANVLQITHQSVFTKKYRVKKKMNLTEDADFLSTIHAI